MTNRPIILKVKVKQPYVERPFVGDMKWVVYNSYSGYIVAIFYNYTLAAMLVDSLCKDTTYKDTFEIGEVYDDDV